MDDLDSPPYVQGRVMDLTLKCMYVQGLLPDDPNPDLEFYKQYFSPRVAELIVSSRYVQWTINLIRNVYPWGTLVTVTIQMLVILPMNIFLNWDNKDLVTESFFALLLCGIVFMTLQPPLFGREDFKDVVVRLAFLIQDDEKLDEADPKNMLQKLEYWNGVFNQLNIKVVVPLFTLGLIAYAVLSLVPQRKLFTHGWYPFDVYATPAYELTMFGWTLESVLLFFLSNTLTIYGVFESYYLKVHFDNLCYKLRNIRQIAIRRIRERKQHGNVQRNAERVGLLQEIVVVSPNRCDSLALFNPYIPGSQEQGIDGAYGPTRPYVPGSQEQGIDGAYGPTRPYIPGSQEQGTDGAYGPTRPYVPGFQEQGTDGVYGPTRQIGGRSRSQRKDTRTTQTKKKINVNLDGITAEEIDKEMLFQQARFAKLHQELISLADDWGSCLNTNLMTLYIINLLTFATTALVVRTAEEMTFKEIMSVVVCSQLVLVYFMYNYLFDLITEGSSAVAEAVYDCDWFDASQSFKLSMLIMMGRANVAIEITPTGLNPLSLRNFAEVADSAYKMLATMESFL